MPSTYAHERFGQLVLEQLPDELQEEIESESDLFHIGLQGPDLMFYYDPLRKRGVAEAGSRLHKLSGKRFFRKENRILGQLEGSTREAGRVYLLGVLCHFILDAMCHGYIGKYERERGVSHAVIEGAFDRSLIEAEGRVPVKEDMVRNFHPSRRSGQIIGIFYPEQGLDVMTKAIARFKFFHHVLRCPHDLKRNLIYSGLKVLGQYGALRGHITTKYEDADCAESSSYLQERLKEAVPVAVKLLSLFPDGFDDPIYELNFSGRKAR